MNSKQTIDKLRNRWDEFFHYCDNEWLKKRPTYEEIQDDPIEEIEQPKERPISLMKIPTPKVIPNEPSIPKREKVCVKKICKPTKKVIKRIKTIKEYNSTARQEKHISSGKSVEDVMRDVFKGNGIENPYRKKK